MGSELWCPFPGLDFPVCRMGLMMQPLELQRGIWGKETGVLWSSVMRPPRSWLCCQFGPARALFASARGSNCGEEHAQFPAPDPLTSLARDSWPF